MKRFLILFTVVVIAVSCLGGCVEEVKTYIDEGQTIDIDVAQEFIIALGANPTTGYGWEETYDETMLEMIGEKTYKTGEEAEEGVVGTGGIEYFRFKALKTGGTEISLIYKRPQDESTPEHVTKIFTVNIE